MKIRNFDESIGRSTLIDISNQMSVHLDPESPFISSEEWFTNFLAIYDQTDLTRDTLIAVDEQGEIKGYTGLSKKSNAEFWFLDVVVSPKYIESSLPGELLEKGLELAREQGAPAIHIGHHVRFTALREKLEQLGHKPAESS